MSVQSLSELRARYPAPTERVLKKQLPALDSHCRRFVGLSPFVVMASSDPAGGLDASPRGGAPGFVRINEAGELLIPDASGNNRLDTLSNIVQTGRVGLLFMVPGVDETLRVNGRAVLSEAPEHLSLFTDERRSPSVVICVRVEEAYLHCAKALMRSALWDPAVRVDREVLPSMGEMIKDQIGSDAPAETREAMLARYRAEL